MFCGSNFGARSIGVIVGLSMLLGGIIFLPGCASFVGRDMTLDDREDIANDAPCVDSQLLDGDPDFYGDAVGLNCTLSADSGLVLRVYTDSNATRKLIGDWKSLITETNQIVYGGNWFATAPKPVLEHVFREYSKHGPTTVTPDPVPMSEDETDATICSSLSYDVVAQDLAGSVSNQDLSQYYTAYPGLEDLSSSLKAKAAEEGALTTVPDDRGRRKAFLTRYDREIKQFCKMSAA